MLKIWRWELDETGEDLQYETTETGEHGHPLCPNCGQETRLADGQVDEEEFTGRTIYGTWFGCDACRIGTPIVYED